MPLQLLSPSAVEEIAANSQTPDSVIYLDIDYQQDNRPFTVNRERFPTIEKLVKDLREEGFKLVTITDLHLAHATGYRPYDEGSKKGYFIKNPDGSEYVGKVWPGDSVFPDYTRKEVRDWWGTLYTDFVKMGIRGFWNDMNEPSVFVPSRRPPSMRPQRRGRKTDHREIHNVLAWNALATTKKLKLSQPAPVRPDARGLCWNAALCCHLTRDNMSGIICVSRFRSSRT
jgi:alpha-glucosidase